MKTVLQASVVKHLPVILCIAILSVYNVKGQTCPPPVATTITSNANTYYPGLQATVSAGSTAVAIGAAAYGTTPVSAGDILLIIQMQGAQIISANDATYGDGVSSSGYLNNAELYAGNMEYVVATNSVPLTGGTLTLQTGTVNNYKKAAFGADGQYTYQVIRVPVYYNLILNADITAPRWNGATGGVIVMAVMNTLNMNGDTINVSGAGFRGGGGVRLTVGNENNPVFVTASPTNANIIAQTGFHASKGEGIAGTPRLINSNHYGSLVQNTEEGYPGGSFGRGAPGNAGGGGNEINSGGGGGGNGGAGGKGGNTYGTNRLYGGNPGAPFAQRNPLQLVMGGGGGAGDSNDGTGAPGGGLASSGAAGGGIVIISAGAIINPGVVLANGSNANSTVTNDAAGGGGAGGSVLINAHSGHSNLTVFANGGNGGTNFWITNNPTPQHGPGGGGGGGVICTNGTLNAASVTGGTAGTTNNGSGTINYGAQGGAAGALITGTVVAFPPTCTALPMKFLMINGKRNGAQVLINWEVAHEKEVTNYTIERSNNGTSFVTAGIVKRGNDEMGRYNFSDASTGTEATVFYRIKARSTNGQTFLSKVITIQTGFSEGALDIGPVPAMEHVTLRWPSTGINKLQVTMFDVTGHAVLSRQYKLKTGLNELRLTDLQSLPNGIYFVKASDGASYRNGKLVKLQR
ncbi:T9SS type A sorting domain-containing protein [Niastella caeni]|uniref:T9SS type A sorting domain-containing protein n=1 Tax=Niastella caeni TaxID=2569763 RepID=A0A4S8H6H7_9BACT|nr:T9SS type A sorting domain-containing protein [Niastella caeni]THU30243.1 T9SS type A sorting domain-containing protein [Niastella caeni]